MSASENVRSRMAALESLGNAELAMGRESIAGKALAALASLGTAGFALMAATSEAEAGIIVTAVPASQQRLSAGANSLLPLLPNKLTTPGVISFGGEIPVSRGVAVYGYSGKMRVLATVRADGTFAKPVAAGQVWNATAPARAFVRLHSTYYGVNYGPSFKGPTPQYYLFQFQDSTVVSGDPTRYGWIEAFNLDDTGVTITRYAYDDTGAFIAAGATPEPATIGMALMAAMVGGATGVRQWKKQRAQIEKPDGPNPPEPV